MMGSDVFFILIGAVMVLALFLTEKPRTHVYTFFIPWALIGGSELARLWQHRRQHRAAPLLGSAAAAAAILVFGTYSYHYCPTQSPTTKPASGSHWPTAGKPSANSTARAF